MSELLELILLIAILITCGAGVYYGYARYIVVRDITRANKHADKILKKARQEKAKRNMKGK